MRRSHEIDMTEGAIFSKIVIFSLPLMFTGILQLLFNAADVIVVGKFAGSRSLAAVGSNGALINLLVNVFVGISAGATCSWPTSTASGTPTGWSAASTAPWA